LFSITTRELENTLDEHYLPLINSILSNADSLVDNVVNQRVLGKQLRSNGCIVYVANHGGEALDFLRKTTLWKHSDAQSERIELSLILMDLEMPIMDGLTCTRRIRDLQREGMILEHIPIIAVTANTRLEQMRVAVDAGMVSDYYMSSNSQVNDM